MSAPAVDLKGEGGALFTFSLPIREPFAEQVRKGKLKAADAKSAELLAKAGVFDEDSKAVEAKASEGESASEGSGKSKGKGSKSSPGDGPPPKVGKGSGRDAWAAYADSIGIDTSKLGGRAEIIKAVEAKASEG